MRGRRRSKLTRDERQREDSRKFLPDAGKNARSLGSLLLMVRNGSSLRHYGALWLPIKWRRLGIAPQPDPAELRAPIVEPVLESFAGSPVPLDGSESQRSVTCSVETATPFQEAAFSDRSDSREGHKVASLSGHSICILWHPNEPNSA